MKYKKNIFVYVLTTFLIFSAALNGIAFTVNLNPGIYEDNFTDASKWNCLGSVSVAEDPGHLWLNTEIGVLRNGEAYYNGFLTAPTKIYKVMIECTGINGISTTDSITYISLTFDSGDNYYAVVNVVGPFEYSVSEIWNVPEEIQSSQLGVYIFMGEENGAGFHYMDWLKVTYWYEINQPPNTPMIPSPPNDSNDIDLDPKLSIKVEDPNENQMDVSFYDSSDNLIGTDTHVQSGNRASVIWNGREYDTTYKWYVVADDGEYQIRGPLSGYWQFTTKPDPGSPPDIKNIKTFYADGSTASDGEGLLLQGMDLSNTYTAIVSGANKVEFDLGTQHHTDNDGSDGWTATFNTKNIINPFAELTVIAYNSVGTDTETITPHIIPVAGWLISFIDYVVNKNDTDFASFSIDTKEPVEEYDNFWQLTASVDFSTGSPEDPNDSPVEAEVPGGVPVDDVGGDYGYSGGIGSSVSISSDGTIIVNGGFNAEVTAKSIGGQIGATLYGDISIENNEIVWHEMYITLHGEVTIPVFLVPLKICGIGVEAGVDITPHVDLTFNLDHTDKPSEGIVPGLGIKIKENSGIEGAVGAMVRAYLGVGFLIGDFYAEAGGDGTLYFRTPPGSKGYFDNFDLYCWISGKLRFLFWTLSGEWTYSWSYNNQMFQGEDYTEEDWTPIDRDDYINQNNYGQFIWDSSSDSGNVIKNAFPHANPSSAPFPGTVGKKQMLVWSHDNKDKNDGVKAMELWYTIWNNGNMNTPQKITSTYDNRLQMDPQIAFDKNGNAVCVFTQTDSTVNSGTSINTVMDKTEIAYCVWDGQDWGEIQTITDNDYMDVSPVLGSNSDGDIALVWSSDSDNDHETIDDRTVYASFWNDAGWSDKIIVVNGEPIVTTPQVAIKDPDNAICVFTVDGDHDPETTYDQDISYISVSNNKFSEGGIATLTADNYQDISPSVVYGADGVPYVVWLKNKYHFENGQKIYDGTLYYRSIDGFASGGDHEILTGSFSDPMAFSTSGSSMQSGTFANVNFAVGYRTKEGSNLGCALVKTNGYVESGPIYFSDSKFSEIDWCMASGSITATAVERPTINSVDNCNLSFVISHGFDKISPVTSCDIDGNVIGYGDNGPMYKGNVMVSLDALDQGGSGVDCTYYRLFDEGSWNTYDSPVILSTAGDYEFSYYSVDNAENKENIKLKFFTIVGNRAPVTPLQPSGPTSGAANVEYTYSSVTTDPDGDQVYYWFDWGDGSNSGWVGPFSSGSSGSAKHIWSSKGNYNVKVKAKDVNNAESGWSKSLSVKMPKYKSILKVSLFNELFNTFRGFFSRLLDSLLNLRFFDGYFGSDVVINNNAPVVDLTVDPNSIHFYSMFPSDPEDDSALYPKNCLTFCVTNLGNVKVREVEYDVTYTCFDNNPVSFFESFFDYSFREFFNVYPDVWNTVLVDSLFRYTKDTPLEDIYNARTKLKGINKITVHLDPNEKIDDVNRDNNIASIDVSYDDIFLTVKDKDTGRTVKNALIKSYVNDFV